MPDRAGSRVLLGVPAEACGLRQPPELAVPATFHSLLAILLPGFALREWAEVRRGLVWQHWKSIGYALTLQVACPARPLLFGYFEYSFISIKLPPMTLLEAPRRLP